MRHAARLPPPPIFDDRRLVQLIAFRKLQIIDERFGVCVFTWKRVSAFFESKHPKRVPEYMTFRLMTFLAIYKSYCKQIWNALKNDTKTHQNSSKIHPKSTEMVPRSAPKRILKTSRLQILHPGVFFSDFWRHLGDFGRHFETQLGAKGVPKSSILASRRAKMSKNEVQNETSKKVWIFDQV